MESGHSFKKIGLAKEGESPENPGGLEKRVALIPSDVKRLVDYGAKVFVERGAGEGIGFKDEEYSSQGAKLQDTQDFYQDKDLIIKFKGPSFEAIDLMAPGTTLFCMAHFHSFPERAKKLKEAKINVIAMEHIVESPKEHPNDEVLGRMAAKVVLDPLAAQNKLKDMDIRILGWSSRLVASVRRSGNRNPRSLAVIDPSIEKSALCDVGKETLFFIHSAKVSDPNNLISHIRKNGCAVIDIDSFEKERGKEAVEEYFKTHTPFEFGMRRIHCLHETGRAGARYGFKLLSEVSPKKIAAKDVNAVVLGYGNVGRGAIFECLDQGVKRVEVLTRRTTQKNEIEKWISKADLIVNGAEQPVELRGKNYLVTKDHAKRVLSDGTVVIDLVGGSASNRSAVENVVECTYLTDPYFVEDGVYFSALWGWPMMGMMKESALRYSTQIAEILLGKEKLIDGLSNLAPGVKPAWVCKS